MPVAGTAPAKGSWLPFEPTFRPTRPDPGRTPRTRPDGTGQVLVISTTNTARIGAGRLLTFTFNVTGGNAAFALVRRPQVFAPPAADNAIPYTTYSEPAVVVE